VGPGNDEPACFINARPTQQRGSLLRATSPGACAGARRSPTSKRTVILWELLSVLARPDADPRWVELLGALKSRELRVAALCSLTSSAALEALLVEAAQLPWGRSMKEVLHALGKFDDSRCAALLMHWLNTPEGLEVAPLLLTALRRSGRAEDVPVLTALAARDESTAPSTLRPSKPLGEVLLRRTEVVELSWRAPFSANAPRSMRR
jgi:hypothetical protein